MKSLLGAADDIMEQLVKSLPGAVDDIMEQLVKSLLGAVDDIMEQLAESLPGAVGAEPPAFSSWSSWMSCEWRGLRSRSPTGWSRDP